MVITPTESERLKAQTREYWNQQSCDTQVATAPKFTRDYFEQIESWRYFDQPFIHSFAQFTRYRGKKVLEVGHGAGTDFIQWLRAGARLSGIDLTPEALANVQNRIKAYGLPEPEYLQNGDAENLPFESNTFDLGYSFGVLMLCPDVPKAIGELVRVVKPGGEIKIMLYNHRCTYIFNQWIKHAVLRGKPWKSLKWVLWNHIESIGNKGYSVKELKRMFAPLPIDHLRIHTEITSPDVLSASAFPPLNLLYRLAIRLAGWRYPWHPSHYVARVTDAPGHYDKMAPIQRPEQIVVTGNPLGFFHCISARKKQ
jgi:ubiquinone/menaquinone biosynthesis C-methylase UbiE